MENANSNSNCGFSKLLIIINRHEILQLRITGTMLSHRWCMIDGAMPSQDGAFWVSE